MFHYTMNRERVFAKASRTVLVLLQLATSIASVAAWAGWGAYELGLFRSISRPIREEFILERLFSISAVSSVLLVLASGGYLVLCNRFFSKSSRFGLYCLIMSLVLAAANVLLPAVAAS